jgi:hypothetical protein
MMDKRFCNRVFPFAWRTSTAISVYEPPIEDLPANLCEGRVTFLKVTCSITGYQPTSEETGQIVTLPDTEGNEDLQDAIDRILSEYFACYGALINVAVFPLEVERELRRTTINFARISHTEPGSVLANPFLQDGARFEAVGQSENRLVDLFPEGGDGTAELDLPNKMVVGLPAEPSVVEVRATIVHSGGPDSVMEAFSGADSVGTATVGPAAGQTHELVIEGSAIDRVVLSAPGGGASLLEFSWAVGVDTNVDPSNVDLDQYPHIIDVEPKVRDLYQAATDAGEVLSGSKSGIKTDKSFTHTESTETSLGLKVSAPIGGTPETPIVGEVSGSKTSVDADQDSWAVTTDASRERRETQSTTTQLSQMYNLMTGYHVGTNRAAFLMLARPHVLQPTDNRTFVQGLRAIEGIQEFFLIVARPQDVEGLCVEVSLETGHFPENSPIVEPEPEYDEDHEDFTAKAFADNGWFSGSCTNIENDATATHTISGGVIDRRPKRMRQPGDPVGSGWDLNHAGVAELSNNSNDQADESLERYDYRTTSDVSVQVFGRICGEAAQGDKARFERTYRVFTRSVEPKPSHEQPYTDTDHLLVTRRGLCVCYKSGDCPEVLPTPEGPIILSLPPDKVIVDEPVIRVKSASLSRSAGKDNRSAAMHEFLGQVGRTMLNSWRIPRRYPLGEVGFLDSEYFKNRVKASLPTDYLERSIRSLRDLPSGAIERLGSTMTVEKALDMDLGAFARRSGLSITDAAAARRRLLGIGNDAVSQQ